MLPRRLITRASLWVPPLVYMAVIYVFSAQSNPLPEVTTHVWDKALHTVEYAGLAVLLCRALAGEGAGPLVAFALATVLAAAYGATDEYHQAFVPLRDANVYDWMVDIVGATVGALGYIGRRPSLPGDRQD